MPEEKVEQLLHKHLGDNKAARNSQEGSGSLAWQEKTTSDQRKTLSQWVHGQERSHGCARSWALGSNL